MWYLIKYIIYKNHWGTIWLRYKKEGKINYFLLERPSFRVPYISLTNPYLLSSPLGRSWLSTEKSSNGKRCNGITLCIHTTSLCVHITSLYTYITTPCVHITSGEPRRGSFSKNGWSFIPVSDKRFCEEGINSILWGKPLTLEVTVWGDKSV